MRNRWTSKTTRRPCIVGIRALRFGTSRGRHVRAGGQMSYTDSYLSRVFEKKAGSCHICCLPPKLVFSNYGLHGERGAWEVSHHRSLACGGSDSFDNHFAAHISCNRSKGAECLRGSRHSHGPRNARCCLACSRNMGLARRSRSWHRSLPSRRICAARLGSDGRRRCSNSVGYGKRYCGVHYGWLGGSF